MYLLARPRSRLHLRRSQALLLLGRRRNSPRLTINLIPPSLSSQDPTDLAQDSRRSQDSLANFRADRPADNNHSDQPRVKLDLQAKTDRSPRTRDLVSSQALTGQGRDQGQDQDRAIRTLGPANQGSNLVDPDPSRSHQGPAGSLRADRAGLGSLLVPGRPKDLAACSTLTRPNGLNGLHRTTWGDLADLSRADGWTALGQRMHDRGLVRAG
jgi:hypothetical protein